MENLHPRLKLRSYGINPQIWKALAGSNFYIPSVGEHVYYFPEGHAEHSTSPPLFSPSVYERPMILCRVLDVRFLAHPENDELFIGISLVPIDSHAREEIEPDGDGNPDMFVASSKKLTPSDANNGGGFSVPRRCADLVFPPLDYDDDPPVQTLSFRDVSGKYWNFRHIFRGTPRRHLLTTGWSKFNNSKLLVRNDCLTFVRNRVTNDCYVGVRRKIPFISDQELEAFEGRNPADENVMSRRFLGKVVRESVMEAAELAAADMPFEVTYYPGGGGAEFVVNAQLVRNSLSFQWTNGTKVKQLQMPENAAAGGVEVYRGRVMIASLFRENHINRHPWRAPSPWRMLLVEWEDAEKLNGEVSPWEVQHLYNIPAPNLYHFNFAWFDLQNSRRRTLSLNNSGASSSQNTNGAFSSHAGNGIQGARQQHLQLLTSMTTLPIESVPTGLTPSSSSHATRQQQDHQTIPTLPHIIRCPGHEQVPPTSNTSSSSSSHNSTLETITSESRNNTTNEARSESPPSDDMGNSYSLKLFGKIINVKVPNL